MELEIKGNKNYITYLKKHLEKEHPSTKGKIEIENNKNNDFLKKIIGGKK